MTVDPSKAQFSTTFDTFKNYSSATGSISVPVESYSAGQYRKYTTTIALDKTLASLQILQNFSFDSSKYYLGALIQVDVDANFDTQTRNVVNGTTLTVNCYVINQTGGVVSNPAFTLSIQVRRFVTPFS